MKPRSYFMIWLLITAPLAFIFSSLLSGRERAGENCTIQRILLGGWMIMSFILAALDERGRTS